jgi:hypothetical protein
MELAALPEIGRLTLAVVEAAVPDAHPDHATFEPFPVHAWFVRHPGALATAACHVSHDPEVVRLGGTRG